LLLASYSQEEKMTVLEEFEATVAGVADRVGASVVGLGRGWGRGSGVVIAPGKVLTSAHNLRRDSIAVTFAIESRSGTAVHELTQQPCRK